MNGQRIEGNELVTYTPVEAYGISTFDVGIVSGGGGDEATVVQSTRFYWVYDPNNPDTSGFTGKGNWFCGVPNTPLANISQEELLKGFENGTRTNLNAEFQAWQDLVDSQGKETDYVKDFMAMVGFNCFKTNA